MAKSLGNSFFIKDALKNYDGEILRFYLLSTHYRIGLNFSEEDLLSSKKRLDKIYRLKKRISPIQGIEEKGCSKFKAMLLEALGDDLNISKALSVVDEFVSKANESLDNKQTKEIPAITGGLAIIQRLLGIGGKDAFAYFQLGISKDQRMVIESLIRKRLEAKLQKDFKQADAIRLELSSMGIQIMDTPSGSVWEKI